MSTVPLCADARRVHLLAELRAQVAAPATDGRGVVPFGIDTLDRQLAGGGLDVGGLHEVTAASPTLGNDAAATLFTAGIGARCAEAPGATVVWIVTRFDLYAPGLEQAGLGPAQLLFTQARDDVMALALAEDALRERAFAAVVAEVKAADQTATRRLQLAAADGGTPMLLLRRWRKAGRDPLDAPSSAMSRWRIGCAPSARLPYPGVGRPRWTVELARQRGGNPFSLTLEACDDTGRLALPAAAPDRAAAPGRAAVRAA